MIVKMKSEGRTETADKIVNKRLKKSKIFHSVKISEPKL